MTAVNLATGRNVTITTGASLDLSADTPAVNLSADTAAIVVDVHAVTGGSGGGGGASALDDLTDVDVSTYTPRTGQSLVFNGTDWRNNYPPLIFVTYLWPVGVTSFTSLFGARPGDPGGLDVVGLNAIWWFHNEPNAADNGIWESTASPGTATKFAPQPGGLGASIFTYQKFDGAGFAGSYITWINTQGGDATDQTQWTAVPFQADNVYFVKTNVGDWNNSSDESLQLALDEIAARLTAGGL